MMCIEYMCTYKLIHIYINHTYMSSLFTCYVNYIVLSLATLCCGVKAAFTLAPGLEAGGQPSPRECAVRVYFSSAQTRARFPVGCRTQEDLQVIATAHWGPRENRRPSVVLSLSLSLFSTVTRNQKRQSLPAFLRGLCVGALRRSTKKLCSSWDCSSRQLLRCLGDPVDYCGRG